MNIWQDVQILRCFQVVFLSCVNEFWLHCYARVTLPFLSCVYRLGWDFLIWICWWIRVCHSHKVCHRHRCKFLFEIFCKSWSWPGGQAHSPFCWEIALTHISQISRLSIVHHANQEGWVEIIVSVALYVDKFLSLWWELVDPVNPGCLVRSCQSSHVFQEINTAKPQHNLVLTNPSVAMVQSKVRISLPIFLDLLPRYVGCVCVQWTHWGVKIYNTRKERGRERERWRAKINTKPQP